MDALEAKGKENFNAGDRYFYPLWLNARYTTDKTKGKPPRINYNDIALHFRDARGYYQRSKAEVDLWHRMYLEWNGSGWD